MREIKFRAWDKELSQFHWIELSDGETWISKDWEPLQQYTGLKDTSGEEIFEGDIAKMLDFGMPESTSHYQIVWGDWQELGWYYISVGDYGRSLQKGHSIEIVGNIYENPELTTGDMKI